MTLAQFDRLSILALIPRGLRLFSLSMFGSTDSSRKYIDLIYTASSKWANWDPPKQIKASISVDPPTMTFTSNPGGRLRQGQQENWGVRKRRQYIYSAKATAALVAQYPLIEEYEQEKLEIISDTVL